MKKIYPSRKSFVKFDDDHYLLYLGEQQVDNYQPESITPGTAPSAEESSETAITAFSYEGTLGV